MLKVKDIMNKEVIAIPRDGSIKEVCALLVRSNLGGLPVVGKDKKIAGYVSDRDIIKAVLAPGFPNKRVSDIMTKKVVSISENVSVEEAAKIFTERPFRYLPVIRGKKVVGMVSRKDVIDRLLSHYY